MIITPQADHMFFISISSKILKLISQAFMFFAVIRKSAEYEVKINQFILTMMLQKRSTEK